MPQHKDFSLYKRQTTTGLVWYAKFWNDTEGKYSKTLSTGIVAEGKKQRKTEAYEVARFMLAEGKVFPVKKTGNLNLTFVEYCRQFWTLDSDYVKEAALLKKRPLSLCYIKNKAGAIRLHVVPYEKLAKISVSELTAGLIKDWQLWAIQNGRTSKTINGALQAMKVPLRYLIKREELDRDPFVHVDKATHFPKEKGILTLAERGKIINLTETHPYGHLAVLLGLLCGMRMGEIRGLQWGDIEDGLILIRHNWQDGEGIKMPKCASFRQVPTVGVLDQAIEAVHKIAFHTEPDALVFERLPYERNAHSGGAAWANNAPYSKKFFERSLEAELEAIGIAGPWHGKGEAPKGYVNRQKERNITFHSLRHTCFTLALIEGATELETKTLAGWKDDRMMANYTGHGLQVIDFKAARNRLEEGLRKMG